MKILIVGGNSALSKALRSVLSEFSEVTTAGRKWCDIFLDLKNPKIVLPKGMDVIVHAAADFGGSTDEEMLAAENINVLGTLKLCQAAVQAKAKHFIFISSIYACLSNDSPYYNIYALSKRHSEEIARFYCFNSSMYATDIYQGLQLTILRPSQIYGDDDSFRRHQPFLYAMIDNAEKGEEISIYGSRNALRNFIHIDDIATIIAKVICGKVMGKYSCTYPEDISLCRIANAAFSAFGTKQKIRFLEDKPNIPNNVFSEDYSLYSKINFYPQITIEEGMRRIALYRGYKI